ncbi:MAG: energy transducer TonB [Verrucomicrobia bacterium]|nr:energy transducer TonB [Verrucomicrobiota bacterium]MDA1069554.1 energy transducer TonB [Verrucomicrobiota bacterium]
MNNKSISISVIILLFFCFYCEGLGDPGSSQEGTRPFLYFEVDELPRFGKENNSLLEYVYRNMKYPGRMLSKGTVVVSFTVTKDGDVCDVLVIKSLSEESDNAVIGALKMMPNWEPGSLRGQHVDVMMFLPIRFKPPGL